MHNLILGVGNIYLETNYLGLETSGVDRLETGREYLASSYEVRLGGSAVNFVTQLKKLGCDVGILGKTGKDETAKRLFALLEKEHIRTDLIKQSESVNTNIDSGLVFEHNGQNIQIVSGNANQSLCVADLDLSNPVFNSVKAIYFGGSFKQKLLWPHYPELFKEIKSKGILIFLDPGRVPVTASKDLIKILIKILPMTDLYLPNELEILSVTDKKDIDTAVSVVNSWGAKKTVVKMGEKGCLTATPDGNIKSNAFKINPVSTVGAGDTFNAAYISEFLKEEDTKRSSIFANAAAALRVSKNFQPTKEEVLKFIEEN